MAREGGRDYRVGIINMNGINDGVLLLKSPGYPKMVEEYAQTFAKQKQIALDVFLSSHAGQFRLHEEYKAGNPYDPNRFVDPMGYRAAVAWNARSEATWNSCRRSGRPGSSLLLADHLHDHLAVTRARVELQQHHLLPHAERQRTVDERDGHRRT